MMLSSHSSDGISFESFRKRKTNLLSIPHGSDGTGITAKLGTKKCSKWTNSYYQLPIIGFYKQFLNHKFCFALSVPGKQK
jgi:hypothetical protein